MPRINITNEAMLAIRSASTAPGGFNQTANRRSDGTWDVPLEEDTLDRLKSQQLPGETLSDTIIRGIALATGRRPN
jgi:hypothetical protein